MADGQGTTPHIYVWFGSLAAALLVTVASSLLTAEYSRVEALRQERRAAYSELVGSAQACRSGALSLALVLSLSTTDTPLVRESINRALTYQTDCTSRLNTAAARIQLLGADQDIEQWARRLATATLNLVTMTITNRVEEKVSEEYINALSKFQVRAELSATASIIPPRFPHLAVVLFATALQEAVLIALAVEIWRLYKRSVAAIA